MTNSRTKYSLFIFLFTFQVFLGFAQEFKKGLWFGYSHGLISPDLPKIDFTNEHGTWSKTGIGYDVAISPHLLGTVGYERATIFNYGSDGILIPVSVIHGPGVAASYYPLSAFAKNGGPVVRFLPYISLGVDFQYWTTNTTDPRDEVEGIYIFPKTYIGASSHLGDYTVLHAGLGMHFTASGRTHNNETFSGQVRLAYDFHVRRQQEISQSYSQARKLADNLTLVTDSMSLELQLEVDKLKFAITEYETLLKGLAADVDSIQGKYTDLMSSHLDTLSLIKDLRMQLESVSRAYDSISVNSWDSIAVLRSSDPLHDLKSKKNLTGGTYLVLYTGRSMAINSQLYEEVRSEYQKVWLVENYYGVRRVLIWLPDSELEKEWKSLSISFSGLKKFDPTVGRGKN